MGKNQEEKSQALRDSIQASADRAEQERQREMFKRRLDLAKKGIELYHNKKAAEAARAFMSYIHVLEMWKKAPAGKLTPGHFDLKAEIHEILLISGVYWDLSKIFDRSRGKENEAQLRNFLNQYYIFSKGMSFAPLSGETLRRYIKSDAIVHKSEFKRIYKQLTGHNCFVVTSLSDQIEAETLDRMRVYRDETLARRGYGRALIWIYYRTGPLMAFLLDRSPSKVRYWAGRFCDRLSKRFSPKN